MYVRRGSGRSKIKTTDGIAAVHEAIEYLRNQEPVRELTWSSLIQEAAKFHVDDVGKKGVVSHTGSNKYGPKERLGLYGRIISCYGENMAFQCINA